MSVQQYAKHRDISVQAVYSLIKRENIEWVKQNGIKMIKVRDNTIKQDVENDSTQIKQGCKEILKPYSMLIKQLKKQIKTLEKTQDKNYLRLEKLFDKVIQVKQLSAPIPVEEFVEADLSQKKKKKKYKNKSKKKKKYKK